jgi:hypothetical protein
MSEISHWGAAGDLLIMLSLVRAKGMQLGYAKDFNNEQLAFDRDILTFPDMEIVPESGDLMKQMRPLLDMVWQAAGANGSQNFTETGDWVIPSY